MKNSLLYIFFLVPIALFAQHNNALDTIEGNQARLDFIGKEIITTQYSNPKGVLPLAIQFDSISKLLNTPENFAEAQSFLGMGYYVIENYEKAIEYYLESARQWEKINDPGKLIIIYNRLAAAYNVRNDFSKTEAYFLKAKQVAASANDSLWIANVNNNLSILYANNGLYEKAETVNQDALAYFIAKKDSIHTAISFMNLGNAYLFGEKNQQAIEAYKNGLNHTTASKIPLLFAVSKTGIGIGLTQTKKYEEALPYLEEGLALAKQINYAEQVVESYEALSNYHSETNNYKEAYQLKIISQKLKDSLLTVTQDKNMANALTKFETEKKEAQVQVLSLENEKASQQKKLYLFIAIGGIIIATLIGFFLYKNQKKNKLLAKQKQLLEATVDEKNILLKETHHRVKNSFQIVSSLLYLQAENVADKEGQLALKEAQNRVRSMVLIHQKLYSKDQLVGIDAQEYISDLIKDILESHQDQNYSLDYHLDIDPLVLSVETITPLGLIINELITNVLKHAYSKESKNKTLEVSLQKEQEELILEVSDQGIGMPTTIEESSFGIQLIKSLAKKLKATLIYNESNPKGTLARLEIKRFETL